MRKVLLAVCAVAMFAGVSVAATPIQLSLWDTIAIPKNDAVYGLEIGIGNSLSEAKGVQWNFIYSKVGSGWGWQTGLVTQLTGSYTGLQTGFVALNDGASFTGVQFSAVNYGGDFTGLGLGFINYTKSLTGVQFGLFNYAEQAGSFALQIGLVNYLGNSSIYKWFPFINIKV